MSERIARLTALTQAVFFLGLFLSAALPWSGGRSAYDAGSHGLGMVVILLHFGAPMLASVITLLRALRGRVPGRGSFALLAFSEVLKAILALLASVAMLARGRVREELLLALGGSVVLVVLVGVLLLRARRSEGWERWVNTLAAMTPWHLLLGGAMLVGFGDRPVERGPWVYLICVSALAPLLVWVLGLGRRGAQAVGEPGARMG